MCKFLYFFVVSFLLNLASSDRARTLKTQKEAHQHKQLEDVEINRLASLENMEHFQTVLNEILVPRVVGTPSHTKVGNYIVKQLLELGWDVEQDVFSDRTPTFGKLNFRNIIARLDPDADRYLVLACHYDSKYEREHEFVGAIDSAVPCAMLLNLAYVLRSSLDRHKSGGQLSLALVFFDGEEAFRQWGPKDSIYGARHLAHKWHKQSYPSGDVTTHLDRIDILMLLDLLGTPDPTFYSFFPATERWYSRLAIAEDRLAASGYLQGYSLGQPEQRYFRHSSMRAHIEDDHVPFLNRNVKVLHVIPTPFPDVWHTPRDDYSALDFNTIANLNLIFRVFVAEYLHLDIVD